MRITNYTLIKYKCYQRKLAQAMVCEIMESEKREKKRNLSNGNGRKEKRTR